MATLNRNQVHRTGREMTPVKHGLVDLISEGYIDNGEYQIPCEIGYIIFASDKYGDGIEATHAFVKDGITEAGHYYYAETYELI